MIVCLCKAVDDRQIRRAIGHGATSADDIEAMCGAGAGCGGCREFIDDMIRRERMKSLPILDLIAQPA